MVGSLPRMNPRVPDVRMSRSKGLGAVIALEGLFASVCSLVRHQVVTYGKRL